MFDVGGNYANRIGNYTVLELNGNKMTVRYEDGSEASLNIGIQERIWENIQAEVEAENSRNRKRKKGKSKVNHYIKSITVFNNEDLNSASIRATVTPTGQKAPVINSGDRFIYYSVSSRAFFAVATITGDPKKGLGKDYVDLGFAKNAKIKIYPIDIDAFAPKMDQALWLDSTELESVPKYKELLADGETYLQITEDDFELLAEALTEFAEDDEDGAGVDDDDDDDDDDSTMLLEDELEL